MCEHDRQTDDLGIEMTRYDDLMKRARAGERIVIDGATGSECLRRGVPELSNGWSGGAALTHPDIVREIHADYIALGADLIASNTFATGRNVLADAGVADQFETCNRQAVELAVQAREQSGADHVVIAGCVSNWSFSGDRPSLDVLRENTVEQVAIIRDAGADLLSLDMMVDIPRMTATLDAASTSGLPLWMGLTIGPEEGHDVDGLGSQVQLREGGALADAVNLAKSYDNVEAMCLMHSDVRLTERGLQVIREHWDGPVGAFAHSARVKGGRLSFEDNITPEEYAAYVPTWQSAGATMIGGCCGIGPEHLRLVVNHLK